MSIVSRIRTKCYTAWLRYSQAFERLGEYSSIHYSCDVSRAAARNITIGPAVYVARDVWLNTVAMPSEPSPKLIIRSGCKIGRRTTISVKHYIELEDDVLLGPSVLIMDHNHNYSDPAKPIHAQGVTRGGRILIGRNCWLGQGSVICCRDGELHIGRNSVIGANAVVTKSVPPFSVVAGNPAIVIKHYDQTAGLWVRANITDEIVQ